MTEKGWTFNEKKGLPKGSRNALHSVSSSFAATLGEQIRQGRAAWKSSQALLKCTVNFGPRFGCACHLSRFPIRPSTVFRLMCICPIEYLLDRQVRQVAMVSDPAVLG